MATETDGPKIRPLASDIDTVRGKTIITSGDIVGWTEAGSFKCFGLSNLSTDIGNPTFSVDTPTNLSAAEVVAISFQDTDQGNQFSEMSSTAYVQSTGKVTFS
jgi:hypothetical protein